MLFQDDSRCFNIKELREIAGLKQVELANVAGITQAYLSEIENGKKPFTLSVAEKITSAFEWLIGDKNFQVSLSEEEIWASHVASFYPENIQENVRKLSTEIEEKKHHLFWLLNYGTEPPSEDDKKLAANYFKPEGYEGYEYEGSLPLSAVNYIIYFKNNIEKNIKKFNEQGGRKQPLTHSKHHIKNYKITPYFKYKT